MRCPTNHFFERFRELALAETRSFTIAEGYPYLPADEYALLEAYCNDKNCDCRRVRLHQLHTILQIVMGWTNSHLHHFIIEDGLYGEPEEEDGYSEDLKNEKRYRLNQFVRRKGFKFLYEYDFGDGRDHTVQVEDIHLGLRQYAARARMTKS